MRVEALARGPTSGIGFPAHGLSCDVLLVVRGMDALGDFRHRWLARIREERVWGL